MSKSYKQLVLPPSNAVVKVENVVCVPKKLVHAARLEADLTVTNGAYWAAVQNGAKTDLPPELVLFTEDKDNYYVPRHYRLPLRKRPIIKRRVLRDSQHGIRHDIQLRKADGIQETASRALLQDTNDKIISLACGRGKTVVSLYSAAEGGRFPLLIVVPTEALMEQWRREIKKIYGLEDDDIGHVQASIENWKGKKVAVAMLHSIVLKKYSQEFFNYWRLVIYDEVHKLGASLFANAAPKFRGERWGLSATMKRSDGMDKVFKLHIGEVAYLNLKQDMKSEVFFIETGVRVDEKRFTFRRGRVNMGQLLTYLSELESRNDLILKYLNKAIASGRKLIVLGERRRNLYDLCDGLTATDSKMVYVGTSKKKERAVREAELIEKDAIFATQQLAKEGLDKKELDTLFILATFGGEGRLQQSSGRIERICEGKKTPNIVIFIDNIGIMQALGNKMKKWFNANGYKIHTVKG